MEPIRTLLEALPPAMRDPVLFAVPFFLLLVILERAAVRKLESVEGADRRRLVPIRRPTRGRAS